MARFGRSQGAQRLGRGRLQAGRRIRREMLRILGTRYSVANKMIDGEVEEAILPSFLSWLVLRI